MTAPLYFEDLAVGQTFGTGTVTVEPEMIKAFAGEYDPQPFHLDEDAARASLFGGLVASGWHTAALTMRLLVDGELRIVGGLIGKAQATLVFVDACRSDPRVSRAVGGQARGFAPLGLIRGRRRKRFLVRCDRNVDLQGFLSAWRARVRVPGSVRVTIDVDPYSFL